MQKLTPRNTLLLTGLVLAVIFIGLEFNRTGDLLIYLSASDNYFASPNLYKILYGEPAVFYYLGNPFLTLLLYPLTLLPVQLSAIIWKLVSIVCMLRIWTLIQKYFTDFSLSQQQNRQWQTLSFIASVFIIYSNLHMVQLTIFMLYLSLEGMNQITNKKKIYLGAFLISIAIAMKISPVVLLPYLFYRKEFKAGIVIVLLCVSYLFIPVVFIGWIKNSELWLHWWYLIDPASDTKIFDMNNRKNHGISTLLSTLFLKDISDNIVNLSTRRHIVHLGEGTVKLLIYAVKVIMVLFTLYFLRSQPFREAKNKLSQFWELSYLFLIIPLFFPQQRIYNFLFLFPAISYLLYALLTKGRKLPYFKLITIVFSFAILLLNLELVLGVFRKYYWHYKTVTYATLIILVLLASIQPKKLLKE